MDGYEAAREELRRAELALMRQREAVAEIRRSLPPGPLVGSYTFASGGGDVALRDLSTGEDRPLIIYHFMFGGRQEQPCPMCSMWADGWNAVADHLAQNVDFALVTQGTVEQNAGLITDRGWGNLRWLSAAHSSFKIDYESMDVDGNQWPFFTVFERDGDAVAMRNPADDEPCDVLLLSGAPLREPVALGGPIVMNTRDELRQAYRELQAGTFLDG